MTDWDKFKQRFLKDWNCGPEDESALFDPNRLIRAYSVGNAWAETIRGLLIRSMQLYGSLKANVLSVPELHRGKTLFVADGVPREAEKGPEQWWSVPLVPLERENMFSGTRFRRCAATALGVPPARGISLMNVRLLGPTTFTEPEVALIKGFIAAAEAPKVVAVGEDAAQQLTQIGISFDVQIWHPSYALMRRQKQIGPDGYVKHIRELVAGC